MCAIIRTLRAVGASVALCGVIAASIPAAAEDLAGTWRLMSETVQRGGETVEPLGPTPLGSMMLDRGGRFMLVIARPDLPKIAANRRDAGTPEENKQILAGMLAFFGTYTVSMPDGLLTIHVEASTFPNWIGSDQKRAFMLTGDEMTWINRAPAVGGETAKLVWRRLASQ